MATVCVKKQSRVNADCELNPVPTAGAVLYGRVLPPGPGPVAGTAVFNPASDSQKPCVIKFAVDPDPTARQVEINCKKNGTFVFATIFNGIASVSAATTPPNLMSNLAVPGVVTAHDIRPLMVVRHTLPICQYPAGNVVGTYVGTHDAAAAAVSVGPSV